MMRDRLALHTWTLDTTPLPAALDAAKKGGWNAVELRRVDFTRSFEAGMSNAQVLGKCARVASRSRAWGPNTG